MLDPTPVRRRKRLWTLALAMATLALAMGLATMGLEPGMPRIAGILGLGYAVIAGGLPALAYLLSALGLGMALARFLCPASTHRAWLALAIGPAAALFLSHALGVLGLLSGPLGQWVALGTLAAGVVLFLVLLAAVVREKPNLVRPPTAGILWVLPAAVTLVAASNPPGWLWQSEASGYDALSYHLQLAQEWAAGQTADRIWPLKHNVYSFLPSYVESANTHLAAALGAARPGGATGLLAWDGVGAIACQLLHAATGLVGAMLVGRLVWALLSRAGATGRVPAEVGGFTGAVLLGTPWIVVVSSMAYNEAAANMFIAGGLLVAIDDTLAPWRRGLLAGALVGAATACKPTAAFMATPLVGLLLLWGVPGLALRRWPAMLGASAAAGLLIVAPFLLRNWLASGNPVFPALTAWFGTAHWSAEQVARFATAHLEPAGLGARVWLLVATAGEGLGNQPRGIFHAQWSVLFPMGVIGLGIAMSRPSLRRVSVLLAAGSAAGLAWWLGWSHCQSRFLLPLAVPMAAGVGLGVGCLALWWQANLDAPRRRLAAVIVSALPLVLAATSVRLFLSQHRLGGGPGYPNLLLPDAGASRIGGAVAAELRRLGEPARLERVAQLGPEPYVNNFVKDGKVYLVGGATPFYFIGSARGDVIYHTTWDQSLLGAAIRALPEQPGLWAQTLRARGIEYVLVDFGEVARLSARDRWGDPDVTLSAVADWVLRHCAPVREWPHDRPSGDMPLQGLYRLMTPGGKDGSL